MRKIIGVALSSFVVLASVWLPVHAATTARINDTTVSDTSLSFDVWLADASAYSGQVILACTETKTGRKIGDTQTPLSPGKYLLICGGLSAETSYSYTISPQDKAAFPTLSGSTTTIAKVKPPVHAEKYAVSAGPEVSNFEASISVEIDNPVPRVEYFLTLGTTSNSGASCTRKQEYDLGSRYTEENVLILKGAWPELPPGAYCVGVWRENLSTTGDFSEGIATVPGSVFVITKQGKAGTPFTPEANGYGCVSTDTSSYCPLAPLPGMGDAADGYRVDVSKGIGDYINTIIRLTLGAIGVLSVLMIVVGGIEYMSTVSMGEKEGAKSRIMHALYGLLLALCSYLILKTINPRLVDGGVALPAATVEVKPDQYTPTSGGGEAIGATAATGSNVNEKISTYDAFLKKAAATTGVECNLIKAFMYAESGGKNNLTSSAGAKGLVQLMPQTFASLGFDPAKINDPETNILAGATYIKKLKTTACNASAKSAVCDASDLKFVIAAYNAGPAANALSDVCKNGQGTETTAWQCPLNNKPGGYVVTRNYVSRVLANLQKLTASPDLGC